MSANPKKAKKVLSKEQMQKAAAAGCLDIGTLFARACPVPKQETSILQHENEVSKGLLTTFSVKCL